MNVCCNNFLRQPIGIIKFIFLITVVNLVLYHYPLYSFALDHMNFMSINGVLTFFSVVVALFVVTTSILFIFAMLSLRFLKFFTIFMFVGNSLALYFILSYQVILDRSMMSNVFNTDISEVLSYYQIKIFFYVFFLGIIPAWIVSKISIENVKRLTLLKYIFSIFATGVLILYLNASTWLWLDKYAKTLGGLSLPWSYTINAIRYQTQKAEHSNQQILLPNAHLSDNNKMIVVLVIGESARSKDFSLYGYGRDTNPELEKSHVISLKNTFSSATYTTASVNSMLSFEGETSSNYEPLPNYLQRIGIDVIWRSKNWGEPTLKVQTFEKDDTLKPICKGEECDYDGVLLTNLTQRIANSKRNKIFIVLHTSGSHGPTYYLKYPPRFEVFKPVCKTVDLKECTSQELINAYDNTIVYTDHFLHEVIETLKQFPDTPSTMIYISDHGESLGEYGLYLHGTPYSIAPEVQKKVPFIIWESDSFQKMKKVSVPSVKPLETYRQNTIFHTVLGAFGVISPVYNKALDIFSNDP